MPSQGAFFRVLPFLEQVLQKVVLPGSEAAATSGGSLWAPHVQPLSAGSRCSISGCANCGKQERVQTWYRFIQLYFGKGEWECAQKTQISLFFRSCWQVLEGHARALLLFGWLRGKGALPGCPAHRGRCRLRALPMEFPRFSRILAFFQNMRKVKHRKTHSFGVDRRPAPTSISRCLKLPCL